MLKQEMRPVEDSVPKVNDELAVGSDLQFQRHWWKFEKVAWVFFALLIACDLAGVFGRGPLAKAKISAPDGSFQMQYERVERFSTPSLFRVQFGPDAIENGKVRLWISESLVKELGNQRVVPQPEQSTVGQDGIEYTFAATTPPASAEFALQPGKIGKFPLRLRVPGHAEVQVSIFVMP